MRISPNPYAIWAALVCLSVLLAHSSAQAWQTEGLRLRGRLQGRWQFENDPQTGDWTDTFMLRRARIDGRWEPANWLRLLLELELADGARPRDVYGRITPHDLLRITAGQFKKPFSRVKLTSPFDLVIPERGLLDRYAVADTRYGGYGGRDIGLMLSGMYDGPVKLRYYLGAFNNPLDQNEYHRDYVGRLQVRIIKGLLLAGNVSYKRYDEPVDLETVTRNEFLFGGDLRWTFYDFRLQLEGAYGDNPGSDNRLADTVNLGEDHSLYGAHAIASYRFKLSESLTLIPAFMAEVFDPNDDADGDTAVRLAGAINADIVQFIRVVLSAEGVPGKAREFDAPTVVFAQLALSF